MEKNRTVFDFLNEVWGKEATDKVVAAIMQEPAAILNSVTARDFFFSSPSAGGNWVGTLCNGIRFRFPRVYEAMPDQLGRDDMGLEAYVACHAVLFLLGADTRLRDVASGKMVQPWW